MIVSLVEVFVVLFSWISIPVHGNTDPPDVSALNVMYSSLNSPQLSGWTANGGDPCGQSWKGITCSSSSVTEINLAGNEFTGGVPYSISQMTDLKYLNLGHNHLTGQLTDMFGQLPRLSVLDLSFNTLTGNLPQSLGSLSSIGTLYLQNNQFTGPIDVLASLPLEDLNVADNQFSGWVPDELKNIDKLRTEGNAWSSGPAPPPPNTPPGSNPTNNHGNKPHGNSHSDKGRKGSKKSGLSAVAIAGIVISALVLVVLLCAFIARRSSSHYIDEDRLNQTRPLTPLYAHEFKELKSMESSSSITMKTFEVSPSMGLKPPPSDRHRSFNDNDFASKFNVKRTSDPISAAVYSLTDLQAATGSFSPSRLIGEGSIGCVYKAKYADGKILAVKKIETSLLHSEDFMEIVSGISRLRHPNITELVGYCLEAGQHLLVYEFLRNGSLHEFLHLSDDYSRPLTWDTRVRIALGTARAVEYLHEVCSPSAVHKNIKSANILLDTELNPHLSDCGLAKFHLHTSQNLGSGYNAPECTSASAYTLKSDVYSFGVVMLELLTGRKPFDNTKPRTEQSLVRWSTPQLHDIDALAKMVDPALRGLYPPKSLSRFADVIALCVQSEPEFRPPMSEVVQALVRLVQRSSMNKRSTSHRSDDSDYPYY
ncbi:Protein STRUBBELIG-RECEPTOR FAMILY 5 [Acorus gramineus]|uniref:Protein STRUBBELIG-RECEPTOR FAMILY 5 n=1 Tax=Acorus gramineus TaxID=55184 RepID=A0AAV9AZ44_ACOGR|nr:Protein STRUBBELIG-RECEPTOR FAMILY 5 [Acorus gramineus]